MGIKDILFPPKLWYRFFHSNATDLLNWSKFLSAKHSMYLQHLEKTCMQPFCIYEICHLLEEVPPRSRFCLFSRYLHCFLAILGRWFITWWGEHLYTCFQNLPNDYSIMNRGLERNAFSIRLVFPQHKKQILSRFPAAPSASRDCHRRDQPTPDLKPYTLGRPRHSHFGAKVTKCCFFRESCSCPDMRHIYIYTL